MAKRRLSLVLAILMAVGMLLSFAGCPISYASRYYTGTYTQGGHKYILVRLYSNGEEEVIINRKTAIIDGVEYPLSDLDVDGRWALKGTIVPWLHYDGTLTGKIGDKYTFVIYTFAHPEAGNENALHLYPIK